MIVWFFMIFLKLTNAVDEKKVAFFWNSSSPEDGLTYYLNYCKTSDRMIPLWKCFPCINFHACKVYGTCCYETEPKYIERMFKTAMDSYLDGGNSQGVVRSGEKIDFNMFQCVLVDNYFYLMVNSCFGENINETSQELCENRETVTGYIPYTHVTTGLTFRNIHCARCNRQAAETYKNQHSSCNGSSSSNSSSCSTKDSDFALWDLEIMCKHYQFMYTITSEDEFLRAARASSLCSVQLKLPIHVMMPELCVPSWHNVPPFQRTSCNSTDPLTLHLCLTLTAPFFRTDYNGRNLFCALCEGVTPFKRKIMSNVPDIQQFHQIVQVNMSRGRINYLPPFSLLLGATSSASVQLEKELKKCSNITWLNEEGDCQSATCTPGKVLSSTGFCVSALQQVKGLGYKLRMKLIPIIENFTFEIGDIYALTEEFRLRFQDIVFDSQCKFTFAIPRREGRMTLVDILQFVIVKCSFVGSNTLTRDEFEELALERTGGTWEVLIDGRRNVTFSASYLQDDVKKLSSLQSVSDLQTKGERYILMETFLYPTKDLLIWQAEHIFIDLSPTLICPYVEVNLTSNATNEEILTFRYRNREIAAKSHDHLSLHNEKRLHICTKHFQRLTRQRRRFKDPDPLIIVQRYLEISCIAVSVACLVAAVLTYALFPQLRSLPGLNNMSLCGSLAVAQTSLILTVQSDIVRAFSGPYCLVHAIVLHYSWLASFFWMSVCCVHMFRVFTSSSTKFTNSTTSSLRKRYCHYCVYAFGCPVLIVVLTSVITWALTDGKSMGYNDSTCFLDIQTSYLIIILSLLVPLCCMLVTNSVLFILTVRTIVGVTRLQSASKLRERQSIMAYVKLSTLTGAFFIVAVVSVQLQQPLVSIFTSPFAALQGLFIFFSFIANRHVGRLYAQTLGCKAEWLSKDAGRPGTLSRTHTTRLELSDINETNTHV